MSAGTVLTVYVWSVPVVGAVSVRGLLAVSAMPWPDDTKSRLYVPSAGAETVTWYVSPEPETVVTGLAVLLWLIVSVQLSRVPSSAAA